MRSWEYFHKLFLKFIFQKPVSLEQVFLCCLLNQDTREIVVRHGKVHNFNTSFLSASVQADRNTEFSTAESSEGCAINY